jgi:hypothetical protein
VAISYIKAWMKIRYRGLERLLVGVLSIILVLLSACSLPQVKAEDRIFLPISLELLGEFQLPGNTRFAETPVGGLSALTYDRANNVFYALSDDRGRFAPARFYTLTLNLEDADQSTGPSFQVTEMTFLRNTEDEAYPAETLDPEGLALSPHQSVWIASEGVPGQGAPPLLGEFERTTGKARRFLEIPEVYLPERRGAEQQRGIADNLGFEALTLNPEGDRLFAATETALIQDYAPEDGEIRSRFLHYWVGEPEPVRISEHLYPVEPAPLGALINGLVELTTLDGGGHFLSLERAYTPLGGGAYSAQLFQIATGGATDISAIASLKGPLRGVQPIRKRLLLDLGQLGIPLENLEGMTLGPRLRDGTQSLLLVSDNDLDTRRSTQFLLFRLQNN